MTTYPYKTNAGIQYQPADATQTPPQFAMHLDAYLPEGTGTLPGGKFGWVVGIHGGGWYSGTRTGDATVYGALAAAGIAVFVLDYTLTAGPRSLVPSWPRCYTDLTNALGYIRDTLVPSGGDYAALLSEHSGVFGTSAGGHLAYLLYVNEQVYAADGWSGPTDLTALFAEGHAQPVADLAGLCGGPDSGSFAAAYRAASPKLQIPADTVGMGPVQVWNGDSEPDVLLADAQAFHDALVAAGLTCDLEIHHGAQHAIGYSGAATGPTIAFFQANLS